MKKNLIQLYHNDIAKDVKEAYIDLLKRGVENSDIPKKLINQYSDIFFDVEDTFSFWVALAYTQWQVGRLDDSVKEQAITQIDLALNNNINVVSMSTQLLHSIRDILVSTQPPIKKIKPYEFYVNDWKEGDIYAYPIETCDNGYLEINKYFLLIKVGDAFWWPGHRIPIVRAKLLDSKELPYQEDLIEGLPYTQIAITNPKIFALSPKKYSEVCKNNIPDEYGFFPHYKFKIITTSVKDISSKIIYLGNFKHISSPSTEYQHSTDEEIVSVGWDDLASFLTERYRKFNLKESEIYNK